MISLFLLITSHFYGWEHFPFLNQYFHSYSKLFTSINSGSVCLLISGSTISILRTSDIWSGLITRYWRKDISPVLTSMEYSDEVCSEITFVAISFFWTSHMKDIWDSVFCYAHYSSVELKFPWDLLNLSIQSLFLASSSSPSHPTNQVFKWSIYDPSPCALRFIGRDSTFFLYLDCAPWDGYTDFLKCSSKAFGFEGSQLWLVINI